MIKFEQNQNLTQYYYFNEPLEGYILDQIDFTVQNLKYKTATTFNPELYTDSTYNNPRKSKLKWIEDSIPQHKYLFEYLSNRINIANKNHFNLDIIGSNDNIQYTEYNSEVKGHYDWHLDISGDSNVLRKLSIIIQLSSPDEYEGGDLEIHIGSTPLKVPKQKGSIIVFPSFLLHRVTPVTKGIRKSLVWWVGGSQFR
jgi:PKHD-type hydroxylase